MKKSNFFPFFLILFVFFFTELLAEEKMKFLSLKNIEVNLRLGPSKEYPAILLFKKKYLPVQILDKFETWRKIKDFNNNSGWKHISQLSNKKTAINNKKYSILYTKDTIYSKPVARLEVGRLVLIEKCKVNWCKIKSSEFRGWIIKEFLWGITK
jgi:SH3-like domain-containing protein